MVDFGLLVVTMEITEYLKEQLKMFCQCQLLAFQIKSTEFVSVDPISVEKGPDLPNNVTLHGLVKVDSTTAMLIGGYDNRERAIADVYSFDFTTQLWTSGPSLLVPIDQAACGTLIDAKTGKTVVIAAGGETANDRY